MKQVFNRLHRLYQAWQNHRGLLQPDYIYNTGFIFLFMYLVSKVPVNFEFINPLEEALEDFELTDIVFSKKNASGA